MLKELLVNIPPIEALEQVPKYAKFMKDLVIKKKSMNVDLAQGIHHCSAIISNSLVQKKVTRGAFTILFKLEF